MSVLVLEPLKKTVWSPAEWEEGFAVHDLQGNGHLVSRTCKVPEGLMSMGLCTSCGGYHENVVDLRQNLERTEGAGRALLESRVRAWLEQHAVCDRMPRSYAVPDWVMRLTEDLVKQARKTLAAEQSVPAMLFVLDHATLAQVQVPRFAVGPDRQRAVRARWHAALRQHLRRTVGRPEYAVFVSEAWTAGPGPVRPSRAKDRKEVLTVQLLTREVSRTGFARIGRPSGKLETGPGVLGELEWQAGAVASLPAMGILAPVETLGDREVRARRMRGLRF